MQSSDVTMEIPLAIAGSHFVTVRAAILRTVDLILECMFSIGLKSGEYGGRNSTITPLDSILTGTRRFCFHSRRNFLKSNAPILRRAIVF